MKIKGLLLGMMACAALAACTNDDIVENNGEITEGKKMDAYIAFSIAPSTNSARDAESSGTTDGGVTGEASVNSVLVILTNADGSDGFTGTFNSSDFDTNYNLRVENAIRVQKKEAYKVLAIVNPNAGIQTEISGKGHLAAYNAALGYVYSGAVTGLTGDQYNNFMMANREEESVTPDETNNSPATAAGVTIEVERVVSKITFRPNNSNIYPVEVKNVSYATITSKGFWTNESSNLVYSTFNRANNGAIMVKNGVPFVQDGTKTTYVDGKLTTAPYYIPDNSGTTWVYDKGTATELTPYKLYIKLESYALVNLSKAVYGVRHIATTDWTVKPLGLLNTSYPYLSDPKSTAKNAWTSSGSTADWFNNTLADIETSISADKGALFNELPATKAAGNQETIGNLLSYCFENAVTKDQQLKGLVTGIVFRGQIYTDANATDAVTVLYKYDGNYYRSILSLQNELGEKTPATIAALSDKSSETDIEDAGIEIYKDGKCYYYSAEIKHFDDGADTTKGVMEYAIMRNNIYSLAITGFTGIGDANFNPDGSGDIVDTGVYITMQASILPWIVRFNNIEF